MSYLSGVGNNIINQTMNTALEFGKSAVHALAPDDYEYYLCSLELYNTDWERKGFLSFVVMPDQYSESRTPIQTIVKTHNGIVTTYNPSFSPIDINLSGTFGRRFRLLSNFQDPAKNSGGFLNLNLGSFLGGGNIGVKSGYGLSKILHHILECSISGDVTRDNRAFFLILNNYSFNTSYVVNVINYSFQQNIGQNMMWYYNLGLRAVSYKPQTIKQKNSNLFNTVAYNAIAGGLDKVITGMLPGF